MAGSDDDGGRAGAPPEQHSDGADLQAQEPASVDAAQNALTRAVTNAQSGLRSSVEALMKTLEESAVFIPLAEDIPDVPEGEEVEMGQELSFRPHMLVHDDGSAFAVAYSKTELVEPVATALNWKTSGGELKFIQVPGHVALELGQTTAGEVNIAGLVINPGTDPELVLQRDEVASIAQGNALPLVGYVAELPEGLDENTQDIPDADPPPPALLEAMGRAKERLEELSDFDVKTTFNPERDREPHLTIVLLLSRHGIERSALADEIMQEVVEHLPPPGYADIVFRDPPN